MNSLKPLLVLAVLGGIGYGVYSRVNTAPVPPPPGVPDNWNTGPAVQMAGGVGTPESGKWSSTPAAPALAAAGGISVGQPMPPFAANTATTMAPGFTGAPAADPSAAPPMGADGPPLAAPPFPGEAPAPGVPAATSLDPAAASANTLAQPNFGSLGARSSSVASSPPVSPMPDDKPPASSPVVPYAGSMPDALRSAQPASAGVSAVNFEATMEAARRQLDAGHLAEAHQQLSVWYDDPRLSATQQQQLTELLDQVAGTVLYSTQPLLEPPYEVQPGERLEDIGRMYNVPWQLLAKINGIDDPQSLRASERLKVVRGPFSAIVSLEKRQLTLMLNGAYAGQFAIGVGRDNWPAEASYAVTEKVANPTYHGTNRTVDADDPTNPLGERWIGLGGQVGMHGTSDATGQPHTELPGCISLSKRDAEDVFDILSEGSKVIIRR